jgi:hypothetical protein
MTIGGGSNMLKESHLNKKILLVEDNLDDFKRRT